MNNDNQLIEEIRTWDAVIGNPPYQASNLNKGGNNILWYKFLMMAVEITKDNGYIYLIHPSDWRSPSSIRDRLSNCLSQISFKYLEIHNFDDGLKTFKCNTRYDWYIAKKEKSNGITKVIFEDGETNNVRLSEILFLPNKSMDKVLRLLAKEDKDRLEIIHDCTYHTHNHNKVEVKISKVKSTRYKYPCVYSVDKRNNPKFIWSSFDNGHFGISKIIYGNGATGFLKDANGEFGLSQYCTGIVCKEEDMDNIIMALNSKGFKEIMDAIMTGFSCLNHNILKYFRKDFWKEFI
jgi:hypothetical protein